MTKRLQTLLITVIVAMLVLLGALFGGLLDGVLRKLNVQIAGHPAIEEVAPQAAASVPAATAPAASATAPAADAKAAQEHVVPVFDLVRVEPSGDAVIAGQGAPGSKVEILSGSDVVASGKANDTGAWAIVLATPLKPGAHDLSVKATAPNGDTVTSSESVAVSVPEGGNGEVLVVLNQPGTASSVLQMPGLKEAEQIVASAGGDPSAIGDGATTEPAPADAAPTQPATAPAVAEIVPTTPTTAMAPATTVTDGKADVSATPTTPAETPPPTGGETAVAQTQPATPAVAPAEAGTAVAPSAPASAAATVAVAPDQSAPVAPAPAAVAPSALTIDAVEIEAGKHFYAAGSAPADAVIRLYVDDGAIGDSKVKAHGRWLFEGDLDLKPGKHVVRADQVDADGKVLARVEVPFDIAEDMVMSPIDASGVGSASVAGGASGSAAGSPSTIIIRHGDNLWTIAKRLYGRGVRYSTIYQANTDQIRNPDLIYPGQVFVVPQGDAAWTPAGQ